jgi:hypothetical protein
MPEFIHYLLNQVPWLWPFVAWALALGVVLAVLTFPAYYLFLPVTQRLRATVSRYLTQIRAHHDANRLRRQNDERQFLTDYAGDHLLRHLDASGDRQWARTGAALGRPLQEIRRMLVAADVSLDGFSRALPKVYERIAAITDAIPKDFEVHPTDAGMAEATGRLRVARMGLIVCLVLLLALISVNTGMLSQIVRDLGFIPPSFMFLGVPLYVILAVLLTIVEAGLGIVHGVLADVDLRDEPVKIRIGPTATAAGAVCVACVEGFFYSRIVPNRADTMTIPLINYTLPQTDVFFMWGFLLVMTLFGLGMICYQNGARVLRGTALTNLRKQLRVLKRETGNWMVTVQQAERITNAAAASASGVHAATAAQSFSTSGIETLLTELRAILERPPESGTIEQPLDGAAVRQIAWHALLWLILTTVVVCLAFYTALNTSARLTGWTGNPIAMALGQCTVACMAGFLMGWREMIVQGRHWQKVTAPSLGRMMGVALIGLYLLVCLFLTPHAYAQGVAVLWFVNMLVALSVTAACYQLTPLFGFQVIWVRKLWLAFVTVAELAYRTAIRALLAVAAFLDGFVAIVAGPIIAVKGRPARFGETGLPHELP